MKRNDTEIVDGCRKRNRVAQKQLYDAFAGKMFAVALRYTKNRDEAEDVLQESFIKIYENIGSYRGESPLEFWIRSVVVNTALKHLKKLKKLSYQEDISDHENQIGGSFTNAISSFQFEQLMEMIRELPEGCQTIFNLYAIEGYQHNEIAQMLNIAEGTSKSQYARARQLLRVKLTNEQRFDNESVGRE